MHQLLTKAQLDHILDTLPPVKRTRPRIHSISDLFQGIVYILHTGSQWRQLPDQYPPWQSCYKYFRSLVYTRSLEYLLFAIHRRSPTRPNSPLLVTDTQSVHSTEAGSSSTKGYDGNKKVRGHKRLVLVDTSGMLWWCKLGAANMGERELLAKTVERSGTLLRQQGFTHIIADKGFCGESIQNTVSTHHLELCAMKRIQASSITYDEAHYAWTSTYNRSISKVRYVVEQFFSWIQRQRRLIVNYERHLRMHEGFITLAGILLHVKRISKQTSL